jgi:hypothetical protein
MIISMVLSGTPRTPDLEEFGNIAEGFSGELTLKPEISGGFDATLPESYPFRTFNRQLWSLEEEKK